MELLLKYEGNYPPPAWERLGGARVGSKIWRFAGRPETELAALLTALERATDAATLAETQAVALSAAGGASSIALLDAAMPFNALVAQLRYPWVAAELHQRVETHFQPIIDIAGGGQPFAHEALCRVRAPDQLLSGGEAFSLAARLGRQDELDLASQYHALARKARHIPAGVPLFLNVMPSTLLHEDWLPRLLGWLREFGVDRRDLVIEVVESERVDAAHLAERCDALRAQGLRIALDDMGAGFNGLTTLAMVRAEFIKIDRTLVHEAQGSRVRSVLLEAIVSMAERLGATVIAEGLERPEDLAFCQGLGIRFAQGYLFARPAPAPVLAALPLPETDYAWRTQPRERFRLTDVIEPGIAFELHTPIDEVRAQFRQIPALQWVVVVDGGSPLGLAPRGRVLSRATRSLAAACQPLRRALPHGTTLAVLARSLYVDRGNSEPWTVIDGEGRYLGVVEPMTLVAHILTRQEHGASLHPLSQLPTGPTLRQAIEARIAGGRGAGTGLVYIDLDHFKAFNDRYGFIRGDAMIRTLAEILRHVFVGRPDRLLGHIGGDDFVLILDHSEPQLLEQLQRVTAQFHALASHLYDAADLDRGYFATEDGARHPIASISVAWVNGSTGALRDSVAAAERAAQLKKLGKAEWGSVVVVEGAPPAVHGHAAIQGLDDWEENALATLAHLVAQPRSRDPHALDHAFKAYPFFEMLFELDAQGIQRYPNWINPGMYGRIRAGGAGSNRSQQPYFREVVERDAPFVSSIYLSTASEDFCLTIAVPIREGGTLSGVLVGDLNLSSMAALLDRRDAA